MKKNIIFVDDEIQIVKGLERLLHSMNEEWNMRFFDKPEEALEIVKKESC